MTTKILHRMFKGNIHAGHEFVDLGLPSGALWATCNIGSTEPHKNGFYCAWGEHEAQPYKSKRDYYQPDYKLFNPGLEFSERYKRYNEVDDQDILFPEDDIAHITWGGLWGIPSPDDFEELFYNTKMVHRRFINGSVCGILTSLINHNSIIFPFSGFVLNHKGCIEGKNYFCHLWTNQIQNNNRSNPHRDHATSAQLDFRDISDVTTCIRYLGLQVRPVIKLSWKN